MFGTVLLTLAALMTGYVSWRAGAVPILHRLSPLSRLGLGVGVWLLIMAGREYGHGGTGLSAVFAEQVGMCLLVTVFLVFMLLLAVDVLTFFGRLLPRQAPGLRGAAMLAGLLLALVALVQGWRPPVVERYEVALQGLPQESDGLVLVAISDLHVGASRGADWLQERVDQAMALQPDMIALLGDIFEGHHLPKAELLPVLRSLRAPLGVYAVQGNHESYGGNGALGLLHDAGITVLLNRWTEPAPGLVLAGVEDLTINMRKKGGAYPLLQTLTGRPAGATVLLSHTPLMYEQAAEAGVELVLSGHTHAGQVWPFNHVVSLRYSVVSGRAEIRGMTAIVSRGAGSWGARMRLWKPGDILHVTLRSD